MQGIQHFRTRGQQGAAENQAVMGVNITNVPEPALQHVYVQEGVATRSPAIHGVAEVTEENKMVLLADAPAYGKWGNPLPRHQT